MSLDFNILVFLFLLTALDLYDILLQILLITSSHKYLNSYKRIFYVFCRSVLVEFLVQFDVKFDFCLK